MATKRKLRDGKIYPVKHRYSLRSKSKCSQFELENFSERFSSLFEDVLGELDYKHLVKFREVSKFWSESIHTQRIYWIRKIEECTEKYTEFIKEWKKAMRKTPLQNLKLIEEVTCVLIGISILNVRSEKNNTKPSSVLLLGLVLFFSERTKY